MDKQPTDASMESTNNKPALEKQASNASTSSKYIPPSLRAKMAGNEPAASSSSSYSARRNEDDATIRVTNLSEDVQESDLSALFKRFGPISRIFLARDRDTGMCKGFAFINFLGRDSAAKAIDVMNGYGFDNLILNVEWSK